jgi:hypothetical protein
MRAVQEKDMADLPKEKREFMLAVNYLQELQASDPTGRDASIMYY